MNINLQSHWLWFFIVLTLYSVYDYIEHISRSGQVFETHPIRWLLFSLFSLVAIILIIYGTHLLTFKLLQRTSLILESFAVAVGVIAHVYITGPLNNFLFWPESKLHFFSSWPIVALLIGVFLAVRLILYLINYFFIKS